MTAKSNQVGLELRKFAHKCLEDCISYKQALLDGLRETQRDPTLNKVALYIVDLWLTEIAEALSTMGCSIVAREILAIRDGCTESSAIGDALVAIDAACVAVCARAPVSSKMIRPRTLPSLAHTRARLLVLTCCDEAGRRLFVEKDIPRLIKKQPQVLDRLYTAAAKLNGLRLDGARRSKGPSNARPLVHRGGLEISIGDRKCRFSSRQQLLFRLLERLLGAPGRNIGYASLCSKGDVWDNRVVSDTTIKGAVSRLRKQLSKSGFGVIAAGISTLLISNRGYVRYEPTSAQPDITPNLD